jgi:hypothetical protein
MGFTDIFFATVVGSRLHQIVYWLTVSLGLLVFLNGLVATVTNANAKMSLTEILPMEEEMQYPVVFGCISDQVYSEGNNDTSFEGCKEDCYATINGSSTSPVTVKVNFFGYLNRSDASASEQAAAAVVAKIAKSLGDGYTDKCWVANYEQEFKPKHGTKMTLQFSLRMGGVMTDLETFGIVGFYQAGSTDAADASYAYTGFQNVLQTIGVSVDEEVDAQGFSWYPEAEAWFSTAKGKTVERYRINTAVTPAVWTADAVGGGATLKVLSGADVAANKTRQTRYIFYLDTFIVRRTTMRNKSVTESINELGAAFGAAFFLMIWLFEDIGYVDANGSVGTAKKSRFMSSETAQARLNKKKGLNFDAISNSKNSSGDQIIASAPATQMQPVPAARLGWGAAANPQMQPVPAARLGSGEAVIPGQILDKESQV